MQNHLREAMRSLRMARPGTTPLDTVVNLDNVQQPAVVPPAADPVVEPTPATDPVLDSANQPPAAPEPAPAGAPTAPVFDSAATALFVDDVVSSDTDITAAAIVQEWGETLPEDLDAGEHMGDRLFSLMVGALPEGEFPDGFDDDAADDLMDLGDAVGDVLADLGVDDGDIELLLNDFDAEVAERVQELVAGSLPEGVDPAGFVLGDGSDEPAFDAVYRKRIAVRGGKKVRINKRVSGKVILTAGQKTAVRKMQLKARTSLAKLRRAKSMRVRTRLGL